MKSSLMKQAERFLREQKSYKRWLAVFLCLAVVVILGTTAALKYRGIAVTTDAEESQEIHTDAEVVSVVAENEIKRHAHTDECYEMICEYAQAEKAAKEAAESGTSQETPEAAVGHTHSDACYTVTGGERELTCGKSEHTHSDSCYAATTTSGNEAEGTAENASPICGQEEHTHEESCYTVEGGERELTCGLEEGAPVAESQIQPLADMTDENQAGATDETRTGETPENTETTPADASETVSEHVHTEECRGELICGYEDLLSDEMNLVQSAETENYSVTVTYSESAGIDLRNAKLQVVEYSKDSERYIKRCEELGYQPDFLLNIGFFVNGEEIDLKKPVNVKITDKNVKEAIAYEIVHFIEDGTEQEQVDNSIKSTENGTEMNFSIGSFSDISGFVKKEKTSGSQIAEVAPIGELSHEKTVEPFEDTDEEGNPVVKYYNLTLNVKGSVDNNGEKADLDVVFVLDTSGSMKYAQGGKNESGPSRISLATTAIENLVKDLDASDSGINAQYKLITFSNSASTYAAQGWLSGDTLKSYLPSDATGGTNYEDALEKAGAAAVSERNAKTVVIFLTDGAPTYYNPYTDARGQYQDGGNGSTTTDKTIAGAVRGAQKISADYFFVVGFGSEMTKDTTTGSSNKEPYEILQEIADAKKLANGGESDASTTTDLTSYFSSFKDSLKNINATNVVFTDILTDKVDIVGEDGKPVGNPGAGVWEIEIKDAEGNVLPKTDSIYKESGMTAVYDSATGLRVSFADKYVLKTDYTYSVTTKIAPNDKAIEEYINNGYMYTVTGDANTGSKSSNRRGIRCNTDDGATLTYSYILNGGEPIENPETLYYPHPVVQVDKSVTPPPIIEKEMTHDKYIAKAVDEDGNELDDVYDLTLDLTARVGSTTKPVYYDILFLVDVSTSMGDPDSSTSRFGKTKAAINSLVDEVERNEKIYAKYSLVPFGGTLGTITEWTYADKIKSAVGNLKKITGTNYQLGLVNAGNLINKNQGEFADGNTPDDSEVTKVIIFLTDGDPTWHLCEGYTKKVYNSQGQWNEHHINNNGNFGGGETGNPNNSGTAIKGGGSRTSPHDYIGAMMGAQTVNCQLFYAIGVDFKEDAPAAPYCTKTPSEILNDVVNGSTYDGETYRGVNAAQKYVTTTSDVASAFKEVTGIITEYNCHDVTVTDTLSDYVEVNTITLTDEEGNLLKEEPAKLTIKVAEFDGDEIGDTIALGEGDVINGASVELDPTEKNDSADVKDRTITAKYENGQIVLDFPDNYKLESKYKYYVTVQIRPTELAYKTAMNLEKDKITGELDYPETGQEKTDHPSVYEDAEKEKISDGQKGFQTNKGATVSLIWDNGKGNGERVTEEYQRPVIKVNQAKLTIEKTISGLPADKVAELLGKMRFIVDGDTQNPIMATDIVESVTDSEGKVTYRFKDGVEVPSDGESITYTIETNREVVPGTYTVEEVWDRANVDGYIRTTSYKVTVDEEVGEEAEDANTTSNVSAQITLGANQSGTVAFTNSYKVRTATIGLNKVSGEGVGGNDFNSDFAGIKFQIIKGKIDEATLKKVNEEATSEAKVAALKEEVQELAKDNTIATLEVVDEKNAIVESLAESYEQDSKVGDTKLVLPMGEYIVIEDRTGCKNADSYAEVYPFVIKVLSTGQVITSDIGDFENLGNVTSNYVTEDKHYQFKVTNRKKKLKELQLLKVHSVNNGNIEGLKGAEFDLYEVVDPTEKDENGNYTNVKKLNEGKGSLVSGEDGKIVNDLLKGLEAGKTYYLTETKAPDGYMLPTNNIVFTINARLNDKFSSQAEVEVTSANSNSAYTVVVSSTDDDGKVTYMKYDKDSNIPPYSLDDDGDRIWTLAIVNDTGAELPVTGGPGTVAYTFGGLAVIALGVMYSLSMRRKREKGGLN